MTEEDVVERGIGLLDLLEHTELSLAAVIDRVELVTTDPRLQREIIERAVDEGIIDRDGETVTPQSGTFLRFQADVKQKEGSFGCRRCGTRLKNGYFIQLADGELGPFGSTCIRKITGRE